jgi:hypothetical protein
MAVIKWEYRQEIFQGVEIMNEWGLEGWELAGFFGKDGAFMLLKRQLTGRAAGHVHPPAASPSASTSRTSSSSRPRPATSRTPAPGKGKEMI